MVLYRGPSSRVVCQDSDGCPSLLVFWIIDAIVSKVYDYRQISLYFEDVPSSNMLCRPMRSCPNANCSVVEDAGRYYHEFLEGSLTRIRNVNNRERHVNMFRFMFHKTREPISKFDDFLSPRELEDIILFLHCGIQALGLI